MQVRLEYEQQLTIFGGHLVGCSGDVLLFCFVSSAAATVNVTT
jgi:hypothetical protein